MIEQRTVSAPFDAIEIKDSRMKLIGFFGLGLLLLSAFLMVALGFGIERPALIAAISWIGVVGCVMCESVIIVRLLSARPRIRIDEEGVFDRDLTIEPVPWSDIRGIFLVGTGSPSFIKLDVSDLDFWVARMRFRRRLIARASAGLGFSEYSSIESGPLLLNIAGSSIGSIELLQILQDRLADYRASSRG